MIVKLTQYIYCTIIFITLYAPYSAFANCTASSSGVVFGGYDVFETTSNDSVGTISVNCNTSTSYTLKLSEGYGTFNERRMMYGDNHLIYNLYTDPSHNSIWGDGNSGNMIQGETTAEYSVYGRIPARQNISVGSYNDTLIITLEY